MSHIHFVGGEKGGVGKSVTARVLAQWLIDHQVPFAGIDGEAKLGAFRRHYQDYAQSVDLTDVESADQIVDRALGAERRVLVDLPAQSARALLGWLENAKVLEFVREMGVEVTFWHVTDGGFASTGEIGRLLEALGSQVHHVVVKNYGRSKDFRLFDASETSRQLESLSGRSLDLPELDAAAMHKIDRFGSSFWAATQLAEGEFALGPLERRRVKIWLDQCYERMDALEGAM